MFHRYAPAKVTTATDDGSAGVAVTPLLECPHVTDAVKTFSSIPACLNDRKCEGCDQRKENWLCLQCHRMFCGRYAQAHMMAHYQAEGGNHCVVFGHDDLSFWCYQCEGYLHHKYIPKISVVYALAHFHKFGIPPGRRPAVAATAATPTGSSTGRAPPAATTAAGPKKITSGADTAHTSAEEYKEHFDSEEELAKKIDEFAGWIRESKHMIVYTGAGISTAAGIPDFRSGTNTVLDTGAGVWTAQAEARKQREAGGTPSSPAVPPAKATKQVEMARAIPTATHMALVELYRRGLLKYVISQNVDGLHRRSGIPSVAMSELHGNQTIEACEVCHKEYLRDFRITSSAHDRYTGRSCTAAGCNGRLQDTIIAFNQDVTPEPLQFAFGNAFQADLCVIIGSSCRVAPASSLPLIVHKNGKRVVIINLQSTPLDRLATRINGRCDDIMTRVMAKLAIPIPSFTLTRRVKVSSTIDSGSLRLTVAGVDLDGTPATIFPAVRIAFDPSLKPTNSEAKATVEPFQFVEPLSADAIIAAAANSKVSIRLSFFGHYNEPDTTIIHSLTPTALSSIYEIVYNPSNGEWSTARLLSDVEMKSADVFTGSGSATRRTFDDLVRQLVAARFDVTHARTVLQSMNSDFGDGFEEAYRKAAAAMTTRTTAASTAPST